MVLAFVIILAVLALFYKVTKNLLRAPPVPKLEETWWGNGNGESSKEDTSIRPFEIKVPDEDLEDLKFRLDNARKYTPPLEGIQQQYGFNTNLLKEIVEFWRTEYNWREREIYLNKYSQFLTNIQGLDIHYIHVKPNAPSNIRVLPLLILHGWPGSVREFYEIIPQLTTPREGVDFVFEVIAPSIPGYGFSQAAVRPGLGAAQISVVMKNLMKRLGHEKYYIQGGDFGAIILQNLATLYPEHVLGFHSNMATMNTPKSNLKTLIGVFFPSWYVKRGHEDRVYPLSEKFASRIAGTGYLHIQATKPDTIGVALRDSPVGLAAYILEKFSTGTEFKYMGREDGGLKEVYNYADLLDNVMFYWIKGNMPTAMRLYAETFNRKHFGLGISKIPIKVATAIARFKNDFYSADGILGEIYHNLVQLSDYEGGHFAAFQLPEVLAKDVFSAVKKFEIFNAARSVGLTIKPVV